MKVVKYADEVTHDYIRKSLEFVYRGNEYATKFSDKLIRVLYSDYQKKVKNLGWFLKDENGRVQNYIEVKVSPEETLEAAISSIKNFDKLVKDLKALGATFTPEELLNNRCTFQKQTQKVSSVLTRDIAPMPYDFSKIKDTDANVRNASSRLKIDKSTLSGIGSVHMIADESFVYKVIPTDSLIVEQDSYWHIVGAEDIANKISQASANNVTLSIDINDVLLSSTGNCSSCLGINKAHSAGAVQMFRTEFSIIAFTHQRGDRFYKTGRSWLFLRATEKGFIRDFPFWKLQKSYGNLQTAQLHILNSFVSSKVEELTGLKFAPTSYEGFKNTWASINAKSNGGSHTDIPGYIDTASDGILRMNVPVGTNSDRLSYSRELLLPFKDMLDLQGNVSNLTSWHRSKNDSGYYGASEENTHEVLCSFTNTIVLDIDAVDLGDRWVRKDILASLLTERERCEVPTETKEVVEETQVTSIEDVDIDDDF